MRLFATLLLTLAGASALASPAFVRLEQDGRLVEDSAGGRAEQPTRAKGSRTKVAAKAAPHPEARDAASSRTRGTASRTVAARSKSKDANTASAGAKAGRHRGQHAEPVAEARSRTRIASRRDATELATEAPKAPALPLASTRPTTPMAEAAPITALTAAAVSTSAAATSPSIAPAPVNPAGPVAAASPRSATFGSAASELVIRSLAFLGTPYRAGGTSDRIGFDCSGFVQSMFERTLGRVLPRSAHEQAQATERIEPHQLQPGDLVFYNTLQRAFSHVGIYVGDGKFIHSPAPGGRVRVEEMTDHYWKTRFDGARRVSELEDPARYRMASVHDN